jgi:putative DNA primase/helicase
MSRVLDSYPWVADAFEIAKDQDGSRFLIAYCPIRKHENGATFKLWLGLDGQLIFGCHGGCTRDTGEGKLEVLRAVGRGWKDCYPQNQDWKAVKQLIVSRYPYLDERGKLLYETMRLEPGRGGKDKEFRQRRPAERGQWVWNLDGVRRVLYRLPELVDPGNAGRTVFVVAGEKDADTLGRIGVLATTNVCGERAEWLDEYSLVLAGRDVVVVEDDDGPGRRHANEVAGSLLKAGVNSLRRCALPEKDATAFLTALRMAGIDDPGELKQGLQLAVREAPKWRSHHSLTRTA